MSSIGVPRLLAGPYPCGSEDIGGDWLPVALGLEEPNRHRTEVTRIGEGRGHMGSAFRVRFLCDHPDHPAPSFVVKLPAEEGPARHTAEQGGLYKREVRFFLDIAHRSPLRVPWCYAAGGADGAGFALVLEDLDQASEVDQVIGLDFDTAKGILLQLADFHAQWWDSADLPAMTWATRHTDEHRVSNLTGILAAGWPRLTTALHGRLPEGCHAAGADMAELLPAAFRALADEPQTLLHGDLRLDNLMFEGPNRPVAILDWQSISRGSAAIDVAYFLAQNLPADQLRLQGENLLEVYVQRLRECGVERSVEQMRRPMALAAPLTFAVASSLFVVTDASEERTRELARVMATRALAAVELFGHPRDTIVGVRP